MSGEAEFDVDFYVNATDAEGDALTYRWTVNGEALDASSSTLGLTFFEAGRYRVEVSVSDGANAVSEVLTVTARDELRPADAPDVVILGFAGRCGVGVGCSAPADNDAYLNKDSATLQALGATFERLGYSAGVASFRANLVDDVTYGFGYLSAETTLEAIRDTWIRDYQNPTRLVLVAHSHGNQFMSLLAMNHPEVTFDYAVYLDAICFQWDADHIKSGRFASVYGAQANWPRPLNVLGAACDTLVLPGIYDAQDISDVVPDNVMYALEVRSYGMLGLPAVYDDDENHRFDGSRKGIIGIYQDDESHMRVDDGDSRAMAWVTGSIAKLGLPALGLTGQAVKPLEPLPAPAGFELDAP